MVQALNADMHQGIEMDQSNLSDQYREEIEKWRRSLDQALRAEDSWLALAGLIWLENGSTQFGSKVELPIHLDSSTIAPITGEFRMTEGEVELYVYQGSDVLVDGQSRDHVLLRPDSSGEAQRMTIGQFTMMLIERGGRLGIRLWDNNRQERKTFPGRSWFPVDPSYRITASFIENRPVMSISIPNELGEREERNSPGYVEFELHGECVRLNALEGANGGLFLLIKDESSGNATYGSGRFLSTTSPEKGRIHLDFNRAYNPPCAFTKYATCPLPPVENYLPFSIIAGEKKPALN
jgi:uncharacterized protein (DUF1684 family)